MSDITEILRKAFLAGVGAAAEGTEKADQLMKDMIRKGELTVEQGKALNQELKHNLDERLHGAKEQKEEKKDISSILEHLSDEDLKELKRRLAEIDIDAGEDDID